MYNLISIVIPTFNRYSLLGETLDSIISQTYTNWECIVVDDGSTDYTEELMEFYCEKDSRILFRYRPQNRLKGANACRNYGFELSKGEYIQWFDSDDVMMSEFLKVKTSHASLKYDMIISSGYQVNMNLKVIQYIDLGHSENFFRDFVMWKWRVFTPSILFKRDFIENLLLFDENLTRGQEAEFFSRLFYQIDLSTIKILNKPLFLYRLHENSKSAENLAYNKRNKESEAFFLVENFKRARFLNDLILLNNLYGRMINIFFKGIKNRHYTNARFINNYLVKTFLRKNFLLSIEYLILGNILLLLKRSSYRIEKRWKKRTIV